MKITVIIPAYNVEKYIGKTIESTLNQTFDDYEVVVINDGSKDRTGDICDKYAKNSNKLKVVHQENGGVMAARLKGIECSHGEWVTFLDGDDRLPENSLMSLYSGVSNDVDVVWGVRAFINDTNEDHSKEPIRFIGKVSKEKYQDAISRHPKSLHGMLFRKALFKDSIVIDRSIVNNEDQIFNLFLSPRVRSAFGLNEVVHHYLVRDDSISKNKYEANYWYHLISYVENNYRKYNLDRLYYERYILTRICCLIRIEGNINFDYNHPCFKSLRQLCYSTKRSVYENLTIFLLKHHNSFLIFLSRIHPSKIVRR